MLNPATPEVIYLKHGEYLPRLRMKLKEYRKRLRRRRFSGIPDSKQLDLIFKKEILSLLLRNGGKVKIWPLGKAMAEKYGHDFDPQEFTNACLVIRDYAETAGYNTRSGTGLKYPKGNQEYVFL